jgi:hypothetical protein
LASSTGIRIQLSRLPIRIIPDARLALQDSRAGYCIAVHNVPTCISTYLQHCMIDLPAATPCTIYANHLRVRIICKRTLSFARCRAVEYLGPVELAQWHGTHTRTLRGVVDFIVLQSKADGPEFRAGSRGRGVCVVG